VDADRERQRGAKEDSRLAVVSTEVEEDRKETTRREKQGSMECFTVELKAKRDHRAQSITIDQGKAI
jgi:hypothetical protein